MICTLGGFVFGPERRLPRPEDGQPDPPFDPTGTGQKIYGCEPAKVVGFVLQTGRIED
jgi:hypothetical protein